MKAKTDTEIIKQHASSVRGRAYIELQIVNKLIEEAEKHNYTLQISGVALDDYDGDFKTAAFDLDECFVDVISADQKALGAIKLVFGNDGYDVIADYTISLETFLTPVNELANFWGN